MSGTNFKMLRTVGKEEAFYFYTSIGCYSGQNASSLEEFLQKIKEVEINSLEFHLPREDFEKWVTSTIGDAQLAEDIRRLREQKAVGNNLRDRLSLIVSKRLKEAKSLSPVPKGKKQGKKSGHL
jgi:hypothetical protein